MKTYFTNAKFILAILISFFSIFGIHIMSYANSAPVFTNGARTNRYVPENTAADENIGDPISATDDDAGDTLTYSLSGTDADSFDIDSASGQLKTVDALDYETKSAYSVTVSVSDGNDATDTIDVTVNVKDVVDLSTPLSERTGKVRSAIQGELKYSYRIRAADIGDSQLLKLTQLNLQNKGITSLQETDFSGLTNLKVIWMGPNSLETLPEDIFDGLSNLEYITLERNSLKMLPEDIFDGLSNLEKIVLSGNPLETLPEGLFDGLSNLEELRLHSMHDHLLNSLPADIFDGLSNLEELRLDTNSLSSLPADIFDGLSSLKKLDIGYNDLTALPAGIFDGLTSLTTLEVNNNDLTALPAGIFDGLTSLTTLALYNNERRLVCTVALIKIADGQFKVKINTAVPFNMELPVSTNDSGSIHGGATTLRVPTGYLESDTFTVRRNVDTYQAATVDIGTPLPDLPSSHRRGYRISTSDDLPLKILPEISRDPAFNDGSSATRSVPENAASDTNIGEPVQASSWNSTYTMTYELGGTDANLFNINSDTGQLTTKRRLNYESQNAYSVTITATDDNDFSSTIDVTINVTNVNEPPRFSEDAVTRSVDENTDADENIGDPISATDPDTDDTLTYTLLGRDHTKFQIESGTGQLQVKAKLDYEKKETYSIRVNVSDSGNKNDTIDVTINVNNLLDESPPLSERTSEIAAKIYQDILYQDGTVDGYDNPSCHPKDYKCSDFIFLEHHANFLSF